jgi:cellulose biosynthesis protein BcsQ
MKVIAFFNNKGGVGKTTLVYHLAWMLAELNYRVLAVDLDPQSNLSSIFLTQERLEEIFGDGHQPPTILGAITAITKGESLQGQVHIEEIDQRIGLIIGDVALSIFEDQLSQAWTNCLNRDADSFKLVSLFDSIIREAANRMQAEIVLIDVGMNLGGAINRATLISVDYVMFVFSAASDLFSLQGIKNLGQTLKRWRKEWDNRKPRNPKPDQIQLPQGKMQPVGYILTQHTARENRPVKSYLNWANRIPDTYRQYVLEEKDGISIKSVEEDKHCLGSLKHYHSLLPMCMEARKPIFLLKPADGAIGTHYQAVQKSYTDFETLAKKILSVCQ